MRNDLPGAAGIAVAALQAQLFDVRGKMVLSAVFSSTGGTIRLPGLAQGVYYLKVVSTDGKVWTTVPIVKR